MQEVVLLTRDEYDALTSADDFAKAVENQVRAERLNTILWQVLLDTVDKKTYFKIGEEYEKRKRYDSLRYEEANYVPIPS